MECGIFTDVSGEQSCISVWDLFTGVMLKSYKNGICGAKGLTIASNQYIFAAQHGKQIIHVYNIHKEQLLKKIICPEKISAIAVSPDEYYLIVLLVDKIYIWQVQSGNLMCVLSKHYQSVTGVQFTRDGKFFVTYGEDNLLLIWDFNRVLQSSSNSNLLNDESSHEKPLHVISQHSMAIQDIYIGSGGLRSHLVTCSADQTCKVFELCSGRLLCNFVFEVMCKSVVMDMMEKFLFIGTASGQILQVNCYDQKSSSHIHIDSNSSTCFKGHKKDVNCLCVTQDGLKLLSGSADCTIKLWHIQSKQCIRTFEFKGFNDFRTYTIGGLLRTLFLCLEAKRIFATESYKVTQLIRFVGEITNMLLRPFSFFNSNGQTQLQISNFQRTTYIPSACNIAEMKYEQSDTIPVILKDLQNDTINVHQRSTYLDAVMKEYSIKEENNSSCRNSNKTATRAQLLHKISVLESLAQTFYSVSTEGIIKQVDAIENIEPD